MSSDARLHGLLDDLGAVYPGAEISRGIDRGANPARAFRILTSAKHPRLAIPIDVPAVVQSALRRDTANDSSRDARMRAVVATLAASRIAPLAFRSTISVSSIEPGAVESVLASATGADVRIVLHGGAQRANAKPVLAVYRTDGTEVGFCKVGVTALATALVQHETMTLRAIESRRLPGIVVPSVVYDGPWHAGSLLLMSAVRGSRGDHAGVPIDAMRALTTVNGVYHSPLHESVWFASLRERLSDTSDQHRDALTRLSDALLVRDGDRLVPFGAWHGDWGPWNMAWDGSRAVVWDWERFAPDVPAGMDAAHFVAHSRLRQIGDLPLATQALTGDAEPAVARVLASLSSAHAAGELARIVVDCYLLEIACRFAVDAHTSGIAPVDRLATWYQQVSAARLKIQTEAASLVSADRRTDSASTSTPPDSADVRLRKDAVSTSGTKTPEAGAGSQLGPLHQLRAGSSDAAKDRARLVVATAGRATWRARMLPRFLISGVQRAGTTSLFRTLARHPDVVPPLMHKGIHYFDTAEHYDRGIAWYQGHFPIAALASKRAQSGRAVTGEASPYYVFHPLAGERIARDLPAARLIVLLRDPVERAYSAHKQESGRGFESETFVRALELEDARLEGEEQRIREDPTYQSFHHQHHAYRRRGHYAEQLRSLFDTVGRDRVIVIETDELFAGDAHVWADLLEHVGLPYWNPGLLPRDNARPSAALDTGVRAELQAYFAPHDEALVELLGREPTWRR